jgi:DNA-binding PadR family transcriptional regulator
MEPELSSGLERGILLHLLHHRGHQVRFEANQWTTEFGILRTFPAVDPAIVRQAIRNLEKARWVQPRMQYVIGYSEPKLVYSLTPSGHRKAADLEKGGDADPVLAPLGGDPSEYETGEDSSFLNVRGVVTSDRREFGGA